MSDQRAKLSEVNAPAPPVPLTAYELVTLTRMIESQLKRALRKAQANAESGKQLPGGDADAMRATNLEVLIDKMDDWLEATWPAVNAARREMTSFVLSPAEEDEAREKWLTESRLEGARLAAQDPDPDDD